MTNSLDVTNEYAAVDAAVLALAQALGLPSGITRLELTFTALAAPIVRVEFYPDLAALSNAVTTVTTQLAEFRLEPIRSAEA